MVDVIDMVQEFISIKTGYVSFSNDANSDLFDEFKLMHHLANVAQKEILHYSKHLIRGYNQERWENYVKTNLDDDSLMIVLDHKAKQCAQVKFESQAEYFGKSGECVYNHVSLSMIDFIILHFICSFTFSVNSLQECLF